jgi:predicted protein tyrosine phosphatase
MQIVVCSRKAAPHEAKKHDNPNIISIVDCGHHHPEFDQFNRRLRLRFDDIGFAHDMGPKHSHIREIISFARAIDERPLIVHCKAGISRSAAAALIVYAVKFGTDTLLNYIKPKLGLIYPNTEMIRLADEMLVLRGSLIAEAEKIRNWDVLGIGNEV